MKLRNATRAIGRQLLGQALSSGMKLWHHGFGQPGLVHERHEVEAGQRRRAGRLDDHRAADRDRRRDLVHDQVQRMVEGRDRRDDADRLVGGERPAVPPPPATAPSGSRGRRSCAARRRHCARRRWRALVSTMASGSGLPPSRAICMARWSRLAPSGGEPAQNRDALVRLQPAVAVLENAFARPELVLQRGGSRRSRSRRSARGRRPGRPVSIVDLLT